MSEVNSSGYKYCSRCGTKMTINTAYCPKCGASQSKQQNKVNKTASSINAFFGGIGALLVFAGIVLVIGSLIALVMKGPMEDPNVKRAWAIGQIIYMIFIPTGLIDISLGLGFILFIVGCILMAISEKLG